MAKLTMDDVDKRLDEIRKKGRPPQGNTIERMLEAAKKKFRLPRA